MRLNIVITLSTFCLSSAAAQINAPPPESQQIENLRAFAKLYGYVRYFHPSDEAAGLDWDAFAIHGARQVRAASDAAQLERILSELFRPVAPTMQITGSSEQAEASPALSLTDTSELEVVAWQHMGLGDGTTNNVYRSLRTNRSTTLTGGAHTGVLVQVLDATPLRSTEVRFTGWGRAVDPDAPPQDEARLAAELGLPAGTDGVAPANALRRIHERASELVDEQYACWNDELRPALTDAGVRIIARSEWNARHRRWLAAYFHSEIMRYHIRGIASPKGLKYLIEKFNASDL